MFGGIQAEREVCESDEDLDELVMGPWSMLVVRV